MDSESEISKGGHQKIPQSLDNPLDNVIYNLADKVNPLFYKLNMTPNQITTLSLILLLVSVGAIIKHQPTLFVILYLASYFFDCADGSYARRYQMTSKYGDLYDHGKDIIGFIIICYVVFIRYRKHFTCITLLMSFVFLIFFFIHIGCEQRYLDDDDSSLNVSKYLCPSRDRETIRGTMQWTRYFGSGSFTLFFTLLVFWLMHSKHRQ